MLTIDQALERILAHTPRPRPERVAVEDALARVLAEDVRSDVDVPPWDNSAMDGYAVRAEDTGEDVTLRLLGTVGAGASADGEVTAGTAMGVMTGAPIPNGADSVVMLEDTDRSRSGQVAIRIRAREGQHVRRRGEDVAVGDVVLTAGAVLGPAALGLLGSIGRTEVAVARRPRVAIVSTGDEVIRPGTPLRPGQIWSSNHLSLAGWVRASGGISIDAGTAPDDLEATVDVLRRAVADADAVLTTGGVSVGHYDVVKEAFGVLGAPIDFWKVAMKPGKPLAFGLVPGGDGRAVPLFGLPGNPVSCVVNFLQFVRPWLRGALGDPRPYLPVVDATLADDLRDGSGRARLFRVALEQGPDGLVARAAGLQSSGVLTGLVRGQGLLLVAAEAPSPSKGDRVRVQVFDDVWSRSDPGYPW